MYHDVRAATNNCFISQLIGHYYHDDLINCLVFKFSESGGK